MSRALVLVLPFAFAACFDWGQFERHPATDGMSDANADMSGGCPIPVSPSMNLLPVPSSTFDGVPGWYDPYLNDSAVPGCVGEAWRLCQASPDMGHYLYAQYTISSANRDATTHAGLWMNAPVPDAAYISLQWVAGDTVLAQTNSDSNIGTGWEQLTLSLDPPPLDGGATQLVLLFTLDQPRICVDVDQAWVTQP
jgi:hypothetical protein